MIPLYEVLKDLNPAVNINNVRIQSNPEGESIIEWDASLGAQPTQTQIDAALPAAKTSLIMSAIRAERDGRLAPTDYLAMPDYPNKPFGLLTYRQALRDFPATVNVAALSWPLDVNALNWPVL